MTLSWLATPAKNLDAVAQAAAAKRQGQLTKPAGSLGKLEEWVIRLAAMQGRELPRAEVLTICLFAGDHGIAREKVSAYPQEVTRQMLANFSNGGAAICVLARTLRHAQLIVHDLGTASTGAPLPGVIHHHLGAGTANFLHEAAMSDEQCARAMNIGREAVKAAGGCDLFIAGEMGIGNTTSATALACALLRESPGRMAGPGTGLDAAGVAHKAKVVENALSAHASSLTTPLQCLRYLGGFEIAALTGSYLACAQLGVPAIVDGFIATTAALVAERLVPHTRRFLLFAHSSAEPGHQRVLSELQADPLLSLQLRLGEGSGAALAAGLLRQACALHAEMATFAQAQVAEKL